MLISSQEVGTKHHVSTRSLEGGTARCLQSWAAHRVPWKGMKRTSAAQLGASICQRQGGPSLSLHSCAVRNKTGGEGSLNITAGFFLSVKVHSPEKGFMHD